MKFAQRNGKLMALSEARAAWQRTANRFIVQEDAKRAPKLAPFSSTTVCNSNNNTKPVDSGPTSEPNGQDIIPSTFPSRFELNPSCQNLSPNTRWWLQLQPSYGHQKVLTDDENPNHDGISSFEDCKMQETSQILAEGYESMFDDGYVSNKVEKIFSSEPYLMGSGRHVPWWRTADGEELASLVAQSSSDLFENCDLPSPRNARPVKDLSFGTTNQNHLDMNVCTPARRSAEGSYKRLRMVVGNQALPASDNKPLSSTKPEARNLEDEQGKAQILEALRHSQTRAREAEKVAKQASAEKEHVIKLVLRQASEIFAYKQLIQLLQLENVYYSYLTSATQSVSKVFPAVIPLKKRKKTRKSSQRKYPCKKRVGNPRSWVDPVVFALGMGLICAGFLLGWNMGWMFPSW